MTTKILSVGVGGIMAVISAMLIGCGATAVGQVPQNERGSPTRPATGRTPATAPTTRPVIVPRTTIDKQNRVAVVEWDAVEGAIGYMVVYVIELAPDQKTVPEFVVVPSPLAVFKLGDLAEKQRYIFAVAAVVSPSEDYQIAALDVPDTAPPPQLGPGVIAENAMTPYVYFRETNPGAHVGELGFYWRSAPLAAKYKVEYQFKDVGAVNWPQNPESIHSDTIDAPRTAFVLKEVKFQHYRFRVAPVAKDGREGRATSWVSNER